MAEAEAFPQKDREMAPPISFLCFKCLKSSSLLQQSSSIFHQNPYISIPHFVSLCFLPQKNHSNREKGEVEKKKQENKEEEKKPTLLYVITNWCWEVGKCWKCQTLWWCFWVCFYAFVLLEWLLWLMTTKP